MDLIFLSNTELSNFRKNQYDKQKGICPILKVRIPFELSCVDHNHAKKSGLAGINNAHMIRGIISREANSAEGRMRGAYIRSGLKKYISFIDYLRSLADYLENPPLYGTGLVHPSGKPKRIFLRKKDYNLIKKYWNLISPKKKLPEFTKKITFTFKWKELLEKASDIHSKEIKK